VGLVRSGFQKLIPYSDLRQNAESTLSAIAFPNIPPRTLNAGHWMPVMALQQSLHGNLRHQTGMASEHLNLDLNLLPHL
jgi:hypothetical protein